MRGAVGLSVEGYAESLRWWSTAAGAVNLAHCMYQGSYGRLKKIVCLLLGGCSSIGSSSSSSSGAGSSTGVLQLGCWLRAVAIVEVQPCG
mgnify:CR=1 FL=1